MDQDGSSSSVASDASPEDPRGTGNKVCWTDLDRDPPQDDVGGDGQLWEPVIEDDNNNGPTSVVARHKQRNKKSDNDNENSVTRHEVFNSRAEARSNRRIVTTSGVSKRHLNFCDLKRSEREREAMSPRERAGAKLRNRLSLKPNFFESDTDTDTDPNTLNRQYTIPPPQNDEIKFIFGVQAFFSLKFRDLIFWLFKTGFLNVMVVALIFYLFWVNLFTLIIYGVVTRSGAKGHECIDGWDYVGTDGGRSLNWELSFSLSWTSFSTVGFGTVSPAVLAGCYGLRYACAIEAFLGVLYAGFCGAIFFAKFSRLMGRAQVIFSSTLCIQYGNGVGGMKEESLNAKSILAKSKTAFPVLEFRVVNERANERGCEILDATISCLVCVYQASDEVTHDRLRGEDNSFTSNRRLSNEELEFDGTPDEKINLMRQKYHNLTLQTRHHPYFRRIWYLRHVLDATSPLLQREVRKKIKLCGQWPPNFNSHASVRASLVKFHDINVTLNGTSNLNASDVFAQYRYKLRDLHVGWQFAGMMYFHDEGENKKIKVDTSLIHDILPQAGGGQEPIDFGQGENEARK